MASGSVLFLGFDLGTTFSSMSYAILNPSLGVKPTIQTASVFVAEGPSVGRRVPSTLSADGNASQWGPFIPSGAKTLRLLKLSLPHEEDLPDHPDHSRGLDEVREAIRMIRHVAGMKGITAVARYLRALWDGCSPEVMVQAFPALLEDMAVRIVFTIPASWREDAISRMRDAVLASGIPNIGRGLATIEFLTESEAAALAILPGLVQSRSCKVGDSVVICDCGGGTADVGSYEVTSLSPLTVRECVPGESQLCGAIFMTGAFLSLIDQKLAKLAEIRDGANINRDRSVSAMRDEWENQIKLTFSPTVNPNRQGYPVFLHGDDNVASGPLLEISSDEIVAVFYSVTKSIIDLAAKQVKALLEKKKRLPKLVVLTGGFGCNTFLQQEFSASFGDVMHFTRHDGRTAVSTGASVEALRNFGNIPVTTGLAAAAPAFIEIPIHIESRIARVGYGYRCGTEPGDDITWFIQKGDEITTSQVYQFDLPSSAFAPYVDQGYHYVPIYRTSDVAPTLFSTSQTVCTAYPFCRIKWKGANSILAMNLPMKVRARVHEHTMVFEVVCNGQVLSEDIIAIETLYGA